MINDPFARDTPGVADPANDCFLITPSDSADIPKGVKALRIWNPTAAVATITLTTVTGSVVTISFPPTSLVIEPIRARRIAATGTTAALVIHGYSD